MNLNDLLIIENNNSKHGYHNSNIIKYGEIALLASEKFIKNIPK